jgi:Lon protease-like protein
MNVVVEGGDRFRLLELTTGRSFTTALVEEVADDDGEPRDEEDAEQALALFRDLAEVTGAEVDEPDQLSPLLDFELAARVDFGVEAKQELLATTSPRARMTKLVELLEHALEAVKLERRLQSRASGNGKVAPLDTD